MYFYFQQEEKSIKPSINHNKTRIELIDKIAKLFLKPYFKNGKIDKDQYKSIMRSVVKKVGLFQFILIYYFINQIKNYQFKSVLNCQKATKTS